LGWLAIGMSTVEILEDFPMLTQESILAALAFIKNSKIVVPPVANWR